MIELLQQGGPFVMVLAALAFVAVFLIFERIFFFQRVRINVGDLLLGLANHVRNKAYAEALHEASRAPGPVARVCHAVLMRRQVPRSDLRDIAQEAGQMEVPILERNLRPLYSIAMVAPLIGMLGTISGLTETFMLQSMDDGFASSSEMNMGIYKSLITSAIGLTIAVPAYLFYIYFYSKVKRMAHSIERGGIEMINIICDARDQTEIVSFREEADELGKKQGS
ncbi:MotA/TolQ/ExbB proton channel family protein [Persicirhabdus sediminis]|uniref:MotA/TolQ/ExbB proton channel family protein n=1 Tax=Persicirhabdus sediminis TaxID=454144 RepID=A0A8J7MH27_9BACT|nr:MotA/TolQ/ExbB proton channel family protein [Persicirhabdus sediminis]MBK1792830.1 MotA/TolQ/ExbB proton channel family protein [Persicirhabdus sediminis]